MGAYGISVRKICLYITWINQVLIVDYYSNKTEGPIYLIRYTFHVNAIPCSKYN